MTTRLPTYSVILTTYNRAHLIHRAVESVLSQTYQNFEFLIIDNGCTDYTQEVLKPYLNDCRVKYLKNPNPTSSCDGPRNFGIELARGVSIAFLDDDDIWYPEKLNTVNQVFVEYPEREIVCHQENIRCGKTIIRQSQYGPWEDNFYERLLYKGNCLSPSATVLKKRIFEQVGVFDLRTSFEGAADYDMWLRIAKAKYKFYFIEDALGEFTITGNNKSINNPAFEQSIFNIIAYHVCLYEKRNKNFSIRSKRRFLQMNYLLARAYLNNRRIFCFLKHIFTAGRLLLSSPILMYDICLYGKKKLF